MSYLLVEDIAAVSSDVLESWGVEPSDDLSGWVAALNSFSLCFLDWRCERYAFSVVYVLLKNYRDEWIRRYQK
jgi:hypothetical protein